MADPRVERRETTVSANLSNRGSVPKRFVIPEVVARDGDAWDVDVTLGGATVDRRVTPAYPSGPPPSTMIAEVFVVLAPGESRFVVYTVREERPTA